MYLLNYDIIAILIVFRIVGMLSIIPNFVDKYMLNKHIHRSRINLIIFNKKIISNVMYSLRRLSNWIIGIGVRINHSMDPSNVVDTRDHSQVQR